MTLATTPPLFDYVENGVTLDHAIPFQFRSAADIRCSRIVGGVETLLTQGADFTVAGGGGGAGTVTKISGGVVGTTFRIKRVTSRAQTTDYTPGDDFPAEVHEAALDHAAAVDQEQDVRIDDVESRAVRVPVGESAVELPTAAARAGKYQAYDAVGAPVPATGTGNDPNLRSDLAAEGGGSLIRYRVPATGFVERTVQDKLGETIDAFDALTPAQKADVRGGSGLIDVSGALQLAVNYLQNNHGGTLVLPNGLYDLTVGLTVGNATAVDGNNTLAPVEIDGVGAAAGVGFLNPNNCAMLKSNFAGPTIKFLGNLGWGLRRIAFTFATASAAAKAFELWEVQSGELSEIVILNCPGLVHADLQTWGFKNLSFNDLEEIYIYMDTSPANAVAMRLTGTGGGGDVALNSISGLHVQPKLTTHVGILLGYADSNRFERYDCNPGAGSAIAVKFDYSINPLFPCANEFIGGDIYDNRIVHNGAPTFTPAIRNVWRNFALGNNAPISSAAGLALDRIKLSGNTTFYVGAGGSATSFGIYAGNPALTVQQVYDQLAKNFDLNGYTVTISVGAGGYAGGLAALTPLVGQNTASNLIINGAGATTSFDTGATPCFLAGRGCGFRVTNLKAKAATSNLLLADGGHIEAGAGLVLDVAGGSHKLARNFGVIVDVGNHSISGNAAVAHYEARQRGLILATGQTITLAANVTVAQFALAVGGEITTGAMTFTLGAFAVTGTRYSATLTGLINTSGGGANYFPGTVAGSTATGGQYA